MEAFIIIIVLLLVAQIILKIIRKKPEKFSDPIIQAYFKDDDWHFIMIDKER